MVPDPQKGGLSSDAMAGTGPESFGSPVTLYLYWDKVRIVARRHEASPSAPGRLRQRLPA